MLAQRNIIAKLQKFGMNNFKKCLNSGFCSLYRSKSIATMKFNQISKNKFLKINKFKFAAASEAHHDNNTFKRLDFKKIDDKDLAFFRSILPSQSILTESLEFYNTDWTSKFVGQSNLVLKPSTNEEVSVILKYCNDNKIAVVPQGGNTGLVGGSVPVHDEVVISLQKMNKIISFDELTGTLYCQAGCVLEDLNNFLHEKGFQMPLDLGAKGSCLIGGNLATNAGGIHFVKFGSLRSNCKGLKFIAANGEIYDCLNPLPKNNTGYDLKHLLIGSEGTLGIITECKINTPQRAKFNDLAIVALNDYKKVVKVYSKAKTELNSKLSAIEFFDKKSQEIQLKWGRENPIHPNPSDYDNFYLVIEVESNEECNKTILEDFLGQLIADDLVTDGVLAQDENQKKKIWNLRESISEAAVKEGYCLKYDVSLPVEKFQEIIDLTQQRIGSLAKVIGYGHIGDYNLHLNVCYDKFEKDDNYYKIIELLEPFIYDYLVSVEGSISAEHGVGIIKQQYLNCTQSENNIKMMKDIKKLFDPNNIMNPYKLFI